LQGIVKGVNDLMDVALKGIARIGDSEVSQHFIVSFLFERVAGRVGLKVQDDFYARSILLGGYKVIGLEPVPFGQIVELCEYCQCDVIEHESWFSDDAFTLDYTNQDLRIGKCISTGSSNPAIMQQTPSFRTCEVGCVASKTDDL
jgi:hypothetical protein